MNALIQQVRVSVMASTRRHRRRQRRDELWKVNEKLLTYMQYKPVGELARALQSIKWSTRRYGTAAVPTIRNFHPAVELRQMLLLPVF